MYTSLVFTLIFNISRMCMKGESKMKHIGLVALRLAVGIVFIYHGWMKLNGIEGTTGMMQGIGLPMPVFFAWLVALVEFIGGFAIILGLFNRIVTALLATTMVVALLTVHTKMPYGGATELPIVLLGALIALHTVGAGKFALMGRKSEECGCGADGKGHGDADDDGCCGGGCDCSGKEEKKTKV